MAKKELIIFFIGLFFLAIIFLPGFCKIQELRAKNEELKQKIEEIKTSNTKLRLEKKRLEEDLVYIEKVARERLGVVREGETIYKLKE